MVEVNGNIVGADVTKPCRGITNYSRRIMQVKEGWKITKVEYDESIPSELIDEMVITIRKE